MKSNQKNKENKGLNNESSHTIYNYIVEERMSKK